MLSTNGGGFKFFSPENTNWIFQEVKDVMWTAEENKRFENALAFIDDKEDLESWSKTMADLIPGKTVYDVIRRYKKLLDDVSDIEAGLGPDPGYGYDDPSETSGCGYGYDYVVGGKRSWPAMSDGFRPPIPEKERKKGVPWTEEEHR